MVSLADMRRDARAAFDAAVNAAQPHNLVPQWVRRVGDDVLVAQEPLLLVAGRRVVMAIGKAGPGMAAAWIDCVTDSAHEIFVLAPHGVPVPPECHKTATILRGAHPNPDEEGEAATRMLLEVASSLGGHDLLVVLLSGGGSSLLAKPEQELRLVDIQATTELLLKAGAPIGDINTVRRQLLAAAGGGLGRAAYPAPVTTLILSDVIGNPVHDIASGPTVPSPSTPDDALSVLERHSIRDAAPRAVVEQLNLARDLTTDDSWAAENRVEIIGDNRTAVDGAAVWLAEHGYAVEVVPASVVGEASVRGREIAAAAEESGTPSAVVFGGETTVTVRGSGRGGRNQELALAAAIEIEGHEGIALLAGGTDGVDGLSENAGAVVDGSTAIKLRQSGIDPQSVLDNNDSGTALEAVGDAFRTGPTGTNVCDLTLVLSTPTTDETKG